MGQTLAFYSRAYHIDACDAFTREYLASEGVATMPPDEAPAREVQHGTVPEVDPERALNEEVAREKKGKLRK